MAMTWRLVTNRAGNAILDANPDWLIIVEGVETSMVTRTCGGATSALPPRAPVPLSRPERLVYSARDRHRKESANHGSGLQRFLTTRRTCGEPMGIRATGRPSRRLDNRDTPDRARIDLLRSITGSAARQLGVGCDVRAPSGNRKQELRARPEGVVYRDGNRSTKPMNPEPLLRINLFEPLCLQLGERPPLNEHYLRRKAKALFLPPGKYQLTCPIPGHEQQGMTSTLKVVGS
jgi:hypothetical protein